MFFFPAITAPVGYSNVLFLPHARAKIPSNTRRSAQGKLSASEMDIATNLSAQIQHTRSGNQIPLSLSFDDRLTAGRDCIAADVRRLAKIYIAASGQHVPRDSSRHVDNRSSAKQTPSNGSCDIKAPRERDHISIHSAADDDDITKNRQVTLDGSCDIDLLVLVVRYSHDTVIDRLRCRDRRRCSLAQIDSVTRRRSQSDSDRRCQNRIRSRAPPEDSSRTDQSRCPKRQEDGRLHCPGDNRVDVLNRIDRRINRNAKTQNPFSGIEPLQLHRKT